MLPHRPGVVALTGEELIRGAIRVGGRATRAGLARNSGWTIPRRTMPRPALRVAANSPPDGRSAGVPECEEHV